MTDEQRLIKLMIDELGLSVQVETSENGHPRFILDQQATHPQLTADEAIAFNKVINKSKEWK